MKTNLKTLLTSLGIVLFALQGCAQTSNTLKEPYWQITTVQDQKSKYKSLDTLRANFLLASRNGQQDSISVASISEIRKVRKSYLKESALVGVITGAVIGYYSTEESARSPMGFTNQEGSAILGMCFGGLAGMIIGWMISADVVYDISWAPLDRKHTTIEGIVSQETQ